MPTLARPGSRARLKLQVNVLGEIMTTDYLREHTHAWPQPVREAPSLSAFAAGGTAVAPNWAELGIHPRIPVLRYVGIAGSEGIRPDAGWFERLSGYLDQLAQLGVEVLSMAQAAARVRVGRSPERAVVLTFDVDQPGLEMVGPLLAQHGMGATAYIVTGLVAGGTHTLPDLPPNPLAWDDVRGLREAGFEVASRGHTRTAIRASSSLTVLDELLMSKALLEDALGTGVRSFAVPAQWTGTLNPDDIAVCGYTSALLPSDGMWDPKDGLYAVPRVTVTAHLALDLALRAVPETPAPASRPALQRLGAMVPSRRKQVQVNQTTSFRRVMFSVDVLTGEALSPAAAPTVPSPRKGLCMVRAHGRPIGQVEIDLTPDWTIDAVAEQVRTQAWSELRAQIVAHLAADGVKPPNAVDDLSASKDHPCHAGIDVDLHHGPLVSVIISTMTNEVVCAQTIRHVLNSTYRNFEVIVVDNRPVNSPLRATLTEAGLLSERVAVVDEPRQGLSCARNRGISHATGELIAVIDDDVTVDRHWLAALVGHFVADPQVGCVTGGILPAELEAPAQMWLEQYSGYHRGYEIQRFDMGPHRQDDAIYPYNAGRFGSGANVAFRADVLRSLGGFSEDLGAGTPAEGCEDIDILRRVVTSESRLVYEPAAIVWHAHRRAAGQVRRTLYRYGVGLAAMLTRWLLESSKVRRDMLMKFAGGASYLLSSDSDKNEKKNETFPRELTLMELAGVASGPGLLLRSKVVARRKGTIDIFGPVQSGSAG